MDSALSPREIQSRIRAGESLEEVANDAGVPATSIASFAGPVLAERRHITELARTAPVRRKEESTSSRRLGDVVSRYLEKNQVDSESAKWDAWRGINRIWTVLVSYVIDGQPNEATFNFDQRGRYSTANNETARDLIGDHPTPAPTTRPRISDLDSEPTLDLNDELALVRVVQESADLLDITDYHDAQLEQIDGVYDIVRNPANDMDVLYQMLASFNEDSVNIYEGLMRADRNQAIESAELDDSSETPVVAEQVEPGSQPVVAKPGPRLVETPKVGPLENTTVNIAEVPAEHPLEKPVVDTVESPAAVANEPAQPTKNVATSPDESDDSQDFLPEIPAVEPDANAEQTKPKRPPKKRASIPSWDEIMFGSPRPPS